MSRPVWLITGLVDDMPYEDVTLVTETLQTLWDAGLSDVIDVLTARVLVPLDEGDQDAVRRAHQLVDERGAMRRTVAALLLDVAWAASVPDWTIDMRKAYALQEIGRAGF